MRVSNTLVHTEDCKGNIDKECKACVAGLTIIGEKADNFKAKLKISNDKIKKMRTLQTQIDTLLGDTDPHCDTDDIDEYMESMMAESPLTWVHIRMSEILKGDL